MATPSTKVHLVYCESGIETVIIIIIAANIKNVHLVYCESGIETSNCSPCEASPEVHLVYCESGIETISPKTSLKSAFI